MRKFFTLTASLVVALVVLAGCFSVGNCPRDPSGSTVPDYERSAQAQTCLYKAAAANGSQGLTNPQQSLTDATVTPIAIPATAVPFYPTVAPAQPTAAPAQNVSNGSCISPETLVSITPKTTTATYPKPLIDALDARAEKVHHATGGWLAKSPSVIWTGLYYSPNDNTLGGSLYPYVVDGLTGVYLVQKDVEIQSPGASACMTTLDGLTNGLQMNQNLEPTSKVTSATGCFDKNTFVAIVNAFHTSGTTLFNRVDELVDMNPQIQLAGETTVTAGKPATRVIWVRDGALQGTDGVDYVKLHSAGGMTMYLLATDAEGKTTWLYRGLVTCNGIDPVNDFSSFWGK